MGKTKNKKLNFLDILIVVLSIYVLVVLLISSFVKFSLEISRVLLLIDDGICVVFLTDFFIRFFKAENKWKFMKWGWIDLISSIPSVGYLRAGRIFRLIRVFRIIRAFRSTEVLIKYIFKSKINGTMTAVTITTILLVIFSSISILAVETAPTSNIKTAEDAIWWTMTTITTVGYGDKYPVTTGGRLIGIILMVSGVGLFGTFTGFIASLFTAENKNKNIEEEKEEREKTNSKKAESEISANSLN